MAFVQSFVKSKRTLSNYYMHECHEVGEDGFTAVALCWTMQFVLYYYILTS